MRFVFIGMGDECAPRFSEEVLATIASGRVFSGGRRHGELVAGLLPAEAGWIEIAPPLDNVFERYAALADNPDGGPVVVFASGDPLFFGFAATVARRLPEAEIEIFPVMNSLQTLAHRALLPYGEMRVVSLTGRPWAEFDRALIEGAAMIGILTDRQHTPGAIARRMVEFGYTGYEMVVGERLGNPAAERVVRLSLDEAAGEGGGGGDGSREFAAPNCVIVHGVPRPAVFGIPDSGFELLDGRARMITKMAVRLATLSMLGLAGRRVFWDVGFCTGSVSIEARLRFPGVAIHAFEIRSEGARLMEINSRRWGAPGIETHIGDFFSFDTGALPTPDAVFIGGHGGRLEDMVDRVAEVMAPGGAVVFNSVSEESRRRFESAVAAAGLTLSDRVRVAVDEHNPIEILKAEKNKL